MVYIRNRLDRSRSVGTRSRISRDAVLHEAARESGADGIVTRNTDDFAPATLSIYTPHELVRALNESL